MENWDKYCGITKNARNILASFENGSIHKNDPEVSIEKDWTGLVKEKLENYENELENACSEALKFCEFIDKLNSGKEDIVNSSKDIHEKCGKLLKERENLVIVNSSLQSKYFYYSHLESLECQIICLTRDPVSMKKKYLEVFAQVQDAIEFFTQHPHYISSKYYQTEYENLSDTLSSSILSLLSEQFQLFYTYYENYFKTIPNFEEVCKIFKQLTLTPDKFSEVQRVLNSIITSYFKIRSKYIK